MSEIEAAWDAEYAAGRYQDDQPVRFVDDILEAVRRAGLGGAPGVYVGCGNGRNYLALVAGGLDLIGLDLSAVAIAQLATRAPERRDRLIHGDLTALPPGGTYPVVIGIQVFQHGNRATARSHVRAAADLVAPGGLLCVRVNAAETDVWPEHDVLEQDADGSFTVRYRAGPKRGLDVHFFSQAALRAIVEREAGFAPAASLRLDEANRTPPAPGRWCQWDAIWRR